MVGSGSDLPEEPECRNESRPRRLRSRVLLSSRTFNLSVGDAVGVGDQLPVDGVAEMPLEGADRFSFRRALRDAAVDVDPAR